MRGNGDAVGDGAPFVQHAHHAVKGVAPGGGVALHCLLQGIPHAVVETCLVLRSLVGVVEGLLVGLNGCLPIVGCQHVPLAVAGNAALLP